MCSLFSLLRTNATVAATDAHCGVAQVNNLFVQFIFSCVFVLSCSMFELIIFEIAGSLPM